MAIGLGPAGGGIIAPGPPGRPGRPGGGPCPSSGCGRAPIAVGAFPAPRGALRGSPRAGGTCVSAAGCGAEASPGRERGSRVDSPAFGPVAAGEAFGCEAAASTGREAELVEERELEPLVLTDADREEPLRELRIDGEQEALDRGDATRVLLELELPLSLPASMRSSTGAALGRTLGSGAVRGGSGKRAAESSTARTLRRSRSLGVGRAATGQQQDLCVTIETRATHSAERDASWTQGLARREPRFASRRCRCASADALRDSRPSPARRCAARCRTL